jgi:hypothetical protein
MDNSGFLSICVKMQTGFKIYGAVLASFAFKSSNQKNQTMKTKHLLFLSALLCGGITINAQDLAPGINYSYNPPGSNGVITGITVDVVENDGVSVGSFDVSMYLYDMSTSTPYVIGTTTVPSLSGSSVMTISNWDIDINNTSGIPAGTYRLGIWVDSNSDISESDENNNAGLLAGNINYNPNASGIATNSILANSISLFPNPSDGEVKMNFTLDQNSAVSVNIYDMTGKLVKVVNDAEAMSAGTYSMDISTSELSSGIYFVTLTTGELSVTRRLTVTR